MIADLSNDDTINIEHTGRHFVPDGLGKHIALLAIILKEVTHNGSLSYVK